MPVPLLLLLYHLHLFSLRFIFSLSLIMFLKHLPYPSKLRSRYNSEGLLFLIMSNVRLLFYAYLLMGFIHMDCLEFIFYLVLVQVLMEHLQLFMQVSMLFILCLVFIIFMQSIPLVVFLRACNLIHPVLLFYLMVLILYQHHLNLYLSLLLNFWLLGQQTLFNLLSLMIQLIIQLSFLLVFILTIQFLSLVFISQVFLILFIILQLLIFQVLVQPFWLLRLL